MKPMLKPMLLLVTFSFSCTSSCSSKKSEPAATAAAPAAPSAPQQQPQQQVSIGVGGNLLPSPQGPDLLQVLGKDPRFSKLIQLGLKTGRLPQGHMPGSFTIFAPTNEAFDRVPKAKWDELSNDRQKLTVLLLHHVMPIRVPGSELATRTPLFDATTQPVKITKTSDGLMVGAAHVIETDIQSSNAVIHVVDSLVVAP